MVERDLMQWLSQRALVCDGAMGTQLMARGLASGECGERWNVERPEDVEAIHRAYRDAGCDLLTTNTFGGTSAALERHGLAERVAKLNLAGAQVARRAAGDQCLVLGDIGPFGGFLEPVGDMTAEHLLAMFYRQAEALKEGGADAIIIETMSDSAEMAVAIRAAKQVATLPVIATYAFAHAEANAFRTMMGTTVRDAVAAAIEAGADVIGANCGTSLGLDDYRRLAEHLAAAAGKAPVILQPNAGAPKMDGGNLVYPATPADMAKLAPVLKKIGVKILGGCCGTTPDHLRAMAKAWKAA